MQYSPSRLLWPVSIFLSLLLLLFLSAVEAKSNIEEMKCAVCRVLVGETNYRINLVDPKKKVQVGSFRVDPDGNQNTHEVPYGRSELHLVEIMENLCESTKHYAETTNKLGKKSLIRTMTYNGEAVSLDDFKVNSELSEKLKYMCDNILEEYEEKMIELFRRLDIKDHGTRLCRDVMRVCTSDDMEIEMPKAPLKKDVVEAAEAKRKASSEESDEDDKSDEETDDEDDNDDDDDDDDDKNKDKKKNEEL
ncbi:protein canopy homolog 2 [Octopus sinensis]|nr:protein canopy homolog 2 [Octopus sinensis]